MTRFHRFRRRLVSRILRMPTPLFTLDADEIRQELERF